MPIQRKDIEVWGICIMKIHKFQIEFMWLMLEFMFLGVPLESKDEKPHQPFEKGGLEKQTIFFAKARPPP
jgi:hypothetical protein